MSGYSNTVTENDTINPIDIIKIWLQ